MNENKLASLYDEEYFRQSYESGPLHKQRQEMYRQEYQRVLKFADHGRVLDVGCGMGDFMALFSEERWTRYGTDISEHALIAASKKGVITTLPNDPRSFFDLIVLRGSLQHLDEPLSKIKQLIGWLKPGGHLVFLATPNSGGICYRLFQDLPMLDPARNFIIFSDKMLANCLSNFGMKVERFVFPYLGTPYAHPMLDLVRFLLRCLGVRTQFAFWGNVMECYARKP